MQQTFVTTPKLTTTITTKNPRVPFKQSFANAFISQMASTYKNPTLENLPISNNVKKKLILNIAKATTNAVNTRIINNNTNHGVSASTYQPTWESVRKNLMRYEIPNADLLQKKEYSLNTKKKTLIGKNKVWLWKTIGRVLLFILLNKALNINEVKGGLRLHSDRISVTLNDESKPGKTLLRMKFICMQG